MEQTRRIRGPRSLVRAIAGRLRPERVELVREALVDKQERLEDRQAKLEVGHEERLQTRKRGRRVVGELVEGVDFVFNFTGGLIRLGMAIVSFFLDAIGDI